MLAHAPCRRRRAIALLATSALIASLAPRVRAQNSFALSSADGMNTRLFRSAMDSKGFFTVNGTDVIGVNDVAFGLVIDGGFGILRVNPIGADGTTKPTTHLINQQFHGNLFANWSPLHNLVIGLGIPVDLIEGDPINGASVSGVTTGKQTDVNAFFVGNYQVTAKYRLTRVEDDPIGVAAILIVDIPASSAPKQGFASDPGIVFTPEIALEKRFGARQSFRIGVNAGVSLMTASGASVGDLAAGSAPAPGQHGASLTHGNLAKWGLGLSYRVSDDVDLVAETYGSYLLKNDAGGSAGLSSEAVGGIKVFVERNSYLYFGGGGGYLMGYQAADYRGFLGFIFEPSIGDRDGDGIPDDIDKCPDEPEDKDGFEDADGCPDPDNDQDGIPDKRDACPNVPETMNGIADDDGCPDGVDGDRDHDGIKDSKDKCPDEPEDKDGFEDQDGCPDPDNDKDGIKDKDDMCPNDPEDKDGFEDSDGCPDPDNDKDGILDKDDKCPNDPETYNGFEDEDGCPDKGRVVIEGSDIVILDKVQFDYDSTKIKDVSLPIVDAVAATLKGHPEFTLVEVQGHADERGDDAHNLKLTQGRVDSVVKALIERGVEPRRIRAKGFGEYCPVDGGHSEGAWEKNRRVEFKIVKTKDGTTGVELGCPNATAHGVAPDPIK
ncbi:MAG: OmpA family protein [Polyangiales bacterium]